jgi:hypothetical protein
MYRVQATMSSNTKRPHIQEESDSDDELKDIKPFNDKDDSPNDNGDNTPHASSTKTPEKEVVQEIETQANLLTQETVIPQHVSQP